VRGAKTSAAPLDVFEAFSSPPNSKFPQPNEKPSQSLGTISAPCSGGWCGDSSDGIGDQLAFSLTLPDHTGPHGRAAVAGAMLAALRHTLAQGAPLDVVAQPSATC